MIPASSSLSALRECPDCGLFSALPAPKSGFTFCCPRCGKSFRRMRAYPLSWTLVSTITALLFYWVVLMAPLLQVSLYSRFRSDDILSGIGVFSSEGYWPLASLVFIAIVAMPLLKLLGFLIVFTGLHLKNPPRWIPALFRNLKHLNPWTMAEIFLLGFLVAYTRLLAMTHVELETAVYALIGLTFSLVALDAMMDHEAVWDSMLERGLTHAIIESRPAQLLGCDICHQANAVEARQCLRCGASLQFRKPDSLHRAAALTVAAIILYVPANLFPVMQLTKLGRTESYTIMRGAKEFANAGLWPLAALVFVVSIIIPATKLLMLGYMMIQTHRQSVTYLRVRTRMYRFIEFIGRWSMIDIFMLSVLVGLMRFGSFAQITTGAGATYFAAVVILNMLATLCFDPRLMWDAADKAHRPAPNGRWVIP